MTRHAPEMTEAKNKSQRLFKLELGKLWAVAVVALVAVVAVFYETYARCYCAAVGLILAFLPRISSVRHKSSPSNFDGQQYRSILLGVAEEMI